MREYIIKRILLVIPTLLGMAAVVFFLIRLIPGDAVLLMMAESANVDQAQIELMRQQLGLDKPAYLQFFIWLSGVLQGDLGRSVWAEVPVSWEIAQRLPITVQLMLMALIISLLIAIPVGMISAVKQDTLTDYVLRFCSILGLSVPNFWLAIVVVVVPSILFLWTPQMGYIPLTQDPLANLGQMIFPAGVLGISLSASVMRITRSALLEVLRQDYIRTAWAKGLAHRAVVLKHALKNSMIPIASLVGIQMGFLLGGSVLIEQIFALPVLGRLVLDAIRQRDYPLMQGAILFIALGYTLINLAVDLFYSWMDPRIRYE
ncbi:MAG: ABC transporter permease [Candidatus Entotheonellia bacterium]